MDEDAEGTARGGPKGSRERRSLLTSLLLQMHANEI